MSAPRRSPADEGGADAADAAGGALEATCRIVNERGLHARAAARFVKTVDLFDAQVAVFNRGQEVSGHSIMGLMMLAAGPGSSVRIVCTGPQAAAALAALEDLIARHFDET
jgi:phosphocarrier protein